MKLNKIATSAALGAVTFIVAGIAFTALSAAATAPSPLVQEPVQYKGSYDLAVLDSPQAPDDVLPKFMDPGAVGSTGLDLDSLRTLPSSDGNRYLVGLSKTNELCLIIALPNDISGASCSNPNEFAISALALRVQGQGAIAEAYLMPDKFSTESGNLQTINPLLTSQDREGLKGPEGYNLALLAALDAEELKALG